MMTPHELRTLGLAVPSAPGRPTYISAASGLVRIASWLYVVADDEHHLGVFREGSLSPGSLFRLMEGDLPPDKEDRKKHKPDFEALVRLPPFGDCTHGALLAVGSGSRDNRRQGVLVRLTDAGALRGAPNPVDLSFILRPHEEVFAAVNIEGAVVTSAELLLFQRGNKKHSANAIVRYSLPAFLESLRAEKPPPLVPLTQQFFDLGKVNDVPLTFTDAAALPNGDLLFSAVAEDTDDSYNDGLCAGSAIGIIAANGTLRWIKTLAIPLKIEGVDAHRVGDDLAILAVTDADDIAVPSKLLSFTVRA